MGTVIGPFVWIVHSVAVVALPIQCADKCAVFVTWFDRRTEFVLIEVHQSDVMDDICGDVFRLSRT